MKTITDYIDGAKARLDIPSDNELARRLGINGSNVNHWRHGRTWPADETMVALAELAGLDVQCALLDLNTWRCKTPRARSLYSEMARQAGVAIIAGILTWQTLPAHAEQLANELRAEFPKVYIMRL